MKFSNGVKVNPEPLKRQGVVSVAWQSILLEEASSPSLADRDTEMRSVLLQNPFRSDEQASNSNNSGVPVNWLNQDNANMALTVKDDLIGVPMAVDESKNSAHAITLHSSSAAAPMMSSSMVLASDSMSEVVNIYLQQAQAYCDEQQWDKAFEACQEVLKVAPGTAEAYKFLGKILQQQGRATDAMGFYAKAIALRPNFPEVYSNLGSLYAQKGKWEEAVSYYKKAIERDPELAVAYLNLAKIWKKLGRKDSEMSCLATALRIQPALGSAQDHYKLAQALEAANNSEGAVLFYQQAVDQDPKMVMAYERLADLLEESGDWQGAAVCYRKVLALNAEVEKERTEQMSAQSSAGVLPANLSPQTQQQIQNLLQASTTKKILQPDSAENAPASVPPLLISPVEAATLSPTEQAQRYAQARDWPRAIECMQSAISQEPQSAILCRTLAKLYEQNNEQKSAAQAWYRSFMLEPTWPDAQQCFTLGRVLSRQGDEESAIRCYRQSVQLEPEFLPAREALEQLLRSSSDSTAPLQGNSTGADALMQQVVSPSKK